MIYHWIPNTTMYMYVHTFIDIIAWNLPQNTSTFVKTMKYKGYENHTERNIPGGSSSACLILSCSIFRDLTTPAVYSESGREIGRPVGSCPGFGRKSSGMVTCSTDTALRGMDTTRLVVAYFCFLCWSLNFLPILYITDQIYMYIAICICGDVYLTNFGSITLYHRVWSTTIVGVDNIQIKLHINTKILPFKHKTTQWEVQKVKR